jgi:hypothetical protein
MNQDLFNGNEEAAPDLNCFFISGGRHDRDRIELQFGFDGLVQARQRRFSYDVDFVLFVPKTLGLPEVESEETLRQEFQSYVRLHTHVTDPKSETSLARVSERLQQFKQYLDNDHMRTFSIEFEGYLKGQNRRVKKEIMRLRETPALLQQIPLEIEAIHALIGEFREILKGRMLFGQDPDAYPKGSIDHDLLLLNEYLSHIYVQHLVELHHTGQGEAAAATLMELLERHMREEYEIRKAFRLLNEERQGPLSTEQEDLYLHRLGLLKKYFQKSLFVNVTGKTRRERILLLTNAIAAALVASYFLFVSNLYQTIEGRIGLSFFTFGVVAYVFKDILKEYFRGYLFKRSSRFSPDFDKRLSMQKEGKTIRLGTIREYLRTFESDRVPEDLRRARYSTRGGDLEEYLKEDVLHFRKVVTLDLKFLDTKKEFPWGLREVVRYRFDRLYPSMEDAFKNLHLISKSGLAITRQCHRVYHVYVATWIRGSNDGKNSSTKPAFKAFRVTLDKMGVLACETLDWKRDFGIPTAP